MNNYEKITAKSEAIQSQTPIPANVKKLQELFPAVVQDGQVDFDALRQLLGESIAESDERYGLQWPGKNAARLEALTPSTKTLRPCVADSKDWPTTKNLYIEGDNLEVLKLLQKSYAGKIKMIYIDPPYNTGQDSFIYPDDYRMSRTEYMEVSNQLRNFKKNQKDCGRFHTNWLNMMFPRLMLAHELLCDDGVIFISIDDNELDNLKHLASEVFGENNFLGIVTWIKKTKPINSGNSRYQLQSKVEYILVYCKKFNEGQVYKFNLKVLEKRVYQYITEKGLCRLKDIEDSNYGGKERSTMRFPIFGITPDQGKRWKIGLDKVDELIKAERIKIINGKVKVLVYPEDEEPYKLEPFWSHCSDSVGTAETGKKELNELLNKNVGFDTVKPVNLIKKLIYHCTESDKNAIVLDFFSGSSTTANAVMRLNAEDGGNRRFIMVQYPEVCDEKKDAAKAGFKNICEIGKERIRRAGKKIEDAAGENAENLDTGFRVFKVDDSNVIPWDTNPEKFEEQLLKASESGHLQEGRTSDDFFYEVLLKQGIELTQDFEDQEIAGHKVYSLGRGMYYCCFDERIGNEAADLAAGIAEWHNKQDPDGKDCVVFVRDSSFDDANVMHGTDARESDARKQSFCATLVQSGIMKVKAF